MNGIDLPARVSAVVVPLDGSRFAERAVPVAARFARRLDIAVHLMSAVPEPAGLGPRMDELAAIRLGGCTVHHSVLIEPDPADAIDAVLDRFDGAVACIASHGRNRSVALVGSVTNEVIRRRRDPLMVVGPVVDDIPGSSAQRTLGTDVVACVDETPEAALLVSVALWWADLLGNRPIALTVAEPVPPPLEGGVERRRFGPDGDPAVFLERLVTGSADDRDMESRVIYDAVGPAAGIRRYVREHVPSLIVVGSRARRGIARLALGSVAAAIVRESVSPVLVVPHADRAQDRHVAAGDRRDGATE